MVARGTLHKVLRVVERSALALGMAAALVVVAAVGARWVAQGEARPLASEATVVQADVREWHPNRVRAWRDALKRLGPTPLATLQIRRLGVSVVVLAGTDDWTLNRAVGHIAGTPKPGDDGNVGLAGHRDGFFRPLKDIAVGDVIEMAMEKGVDRYRVTRDLDRQSQRRVGARPHRNADADARDLLPVLLHRLGAEAVHRPGGARRRNRNPVDHPVGEGGSDACL